MVEILCTNCKKKSYVMDSDWSEVKHCLFCNQEVSKIYDIPFTSFENVLKHIFLTQGCEILKDKAKFISHLQKIGNTYETYKKEIRILTYFCTEEMFFQFYEYREHKEILEKKKQFAEQEFMEGGITKEVANQLLDSMTFILTNIKNPKICLPKGFRFVEMKEIDTSKVKEVFDTKHKLDSEQKDKKSDVTALRFFQSKKVAGTVVAVGLNTYGKCNVTDWKDIVAISASYHHTVGLKKDGTVVAVGDNKQEQCNVESWNDIIAISAGICHTVGLKLNGTVVAVGKNENGQCDVENWKDIIAISAGVCHTVGLKSNGTVVVVGKNWYGQCEVKDWNDIIAISAGWQHTVGLKADGTVVAVGNNKQEQCNVENWKDIVAISVGSYHTVGLKSNGTVVAVGQNWYGQCDVKHWKDIIAISTDTYDTFGLKSNGTVVAMGYNGNGQCNVKDWNNIIAISAGNVHTVGLKSK